MNMAGGSEASWLLRKRMAYRHSLFNMGLSSLRTKDICTLKKKYHQTHRSIPCIARIPDFTAVFGESYLDLLTKVSSYPSNRVIVTGPPRYDLLINASKVYSKQNFQKKYGIPKDNKLILWTTQCHSLSDGENEENFEAILPSLRDAERHYSDY